MQQKTKKVRRRPKCEWTFVSEAELNKIMSQFLNISNNEERARIEFNSSGIERFLQEQKEDPYSVFNCETRGQAKR